MNDLECSMSSSLADWSLYKAEDEEGHNKQHGAKWVADFCTIVPVNCRGKYSNVEITANAIKIST